jgi:predicted MFS family arabinose efflux permease
MPGRVQGAYRAVSNGGLLAGAVLGGLLTSTVSLTAPLWLGLAAIATVIALAWHAAGTGPDAPHHSGAQRAIR